MIDEALTEIVDVVRRDGWSHPAAAEETGPYSVLASLALHLVDLSDAGPFALFPAVFGALERWLARGDAAIRNVLIVGLIEDLQNISLNRGIALDSWEEWLGTRSRDAWDVVMGMWAGRVTPDALKAYVEGRPADAEPTT